MFMVSIIVVFVMWVCDNLFCSGDMKWLLSLGGMFVGEYGVEVFLYCFNVGEKFWFWGGFVVFGLVLLVLGWMFDCIVFGVDYYCSIM